MFLAIALSFHGDKAVSAIENDLAATDDTTNVSKGGSVTTEGGLINFQRDIIPILKESKLSKNSVTFTPINPSDLIALDGLLPPKSTWITPRL